MKNYRYLVSATDKDRRLWLALQIPHAEQGTVLAHTLTELNAILSSIAQEPDSLHGIIIHAASAEHPATTPNSDSNNPADIEQLSAVTNLLRNTSQLLKQTALPSVVVLDGLASFYQLPLAMAADYCIASAEQNAPLAFTEVQFGLHPNITSTQAAVCRLGTTRAMDYLLTGKILSAQAAAANGLIDACVPYADLWNTAERLIDQTPNTLRAGLAQQLRSATIIRRLADVNLHEKARKIGLLEDYPAPHALIDLWKRYGRNNTAVAQQAYAASLENLLASDQASNLTRVVQLKQRLASPNLSLNAGTLQSIHLIGSGATAADIATYLLLQGLNLTLQDKQAEATTKTLELVRQNLTEHLQHTEHQSSTLLNKLSPDKEGSGAKTADMVLVVKNVSLADGQEIFADLEERARPDALLAMNTATLALDKVAAAMLTPQRLLGIHFCYPALKTALAEVSFTEQTDFALVERSLDALQKLGKLPLPMRNNPGLLVDRILVQYILQGIRLKQQGVPHTVIDRAGRGCGMPDGPLELADKIGLDYCLRLGEVLEKAGKIEIPYQLVEMVKTGKLGIKSGSGFYRYRNGNRLKPERMEWNGSEQALQEKLAGQIREEASICLEDGLLEEPDLVDAGIVLGAGFAPYLGGPLYHQRNRNRVKQTG